MIFAVFIEFTNQIRCALSWHRKTPFKQRRLDLFLISDSLQENIELVDNIPSVQSDHFVVKIKLCSSKENAKGPSHWTFNNSLVNGRQFTDLLRAEIPRYKAEASAFGDPSMRWEFLKYKYKYKCREFFYTKTQRTKTLAYISIEKVTELESQISSNSSDHLINEYNQYKAELEKLYDYITAGIILRSRTTWYKQGEKSSKYFMNLEKRSRGKSHVRKLMTENDIQIDPSSIMSYVKNFYSSLYKRRSSKSGKDCLEYLKNISIPKLTENERDSCEGILAKKECWDALQSMEYNKSPGNDGLMSAF